MKAFKLHNLKDLANTKDDGQETQVKVPPTLSDFVPPRRAGRGKNWTKLTGCRLMVPNPNVVNPLATISIGEDVQWQVPWIVSAGFVVWQMAPGRTDFIGIRAAGKKDEHSTKIQTKGKGSKSITIAFPSSLNKMLFGRSVPGRYDAGWEVVQGVLVIDLASLVRVED